MNSHKKKQNLFFKKNYSEFIDPNQEKEEEHSLIQEFHYHPIEKLPHLREFLSGNKSVFFFFFYSD